MYRAMKTVLFATLMVVLLGASAFAQQMGSGYQQQFENGKIDWQDGMVTATGVGAPPPNAANMAQARAMAVRAATVVARRNLLEIVKGVQIDSQTTVENYMVSNDLVVNQVRGFLQNSRILDTAYMSDGSVEVIVGISLRGGFANVITPGTTPFKQAPTPAPAPQVQQPNVFTGLLIDARGLNGRPAMTPRVVDENGTEVYGTSFVSREYAIQQGMAGYAKDETQARQNPRITDNPIMIKAVEASGPSRTDLVISAVDAQRIRDAAQNQSFLEKCKVMILLD